MRPPRKSSAQKSTKHQAPHENAPSAGELDFDALQSLETTGELDQSIPFTQSQPDRSPAKSTVASIKPAAITKLNPPSIGFRFNRLILIVIGLGIGALVWGGRDWVLASRASATPQDITCAELSANGPVNNLHVRVTNFLSMSNYVWHAPGVSQPWDTVWLPIIPPNEVKLLPHKRLIAGAKVIRVGENLVDVSLIHVLIKTHIIKGKEDVEAAMTRDSVEGMVINKIENMTEKTATFCAKATRPWQSITATLLKMAGNPKRPGVALNCSRAGRHRLWSVPCFQT